MKAWMALLAVAFVAGCVGQPARLGFDDFSSLGSADINGTRSVRNSAEITPPTDFKDSMAAESIYWRMDANGTKAVTVWMFDYAENWKAKAAVEKAYQRLQTQEGFPTFATEYRQKRAGDVTAYTVSVLGGRLDIYMFHIKNMAFWVQQTETESGYAEELALEIIRLASKPSTKPSNTKD